MWGAAEAYREALSLAIAPYAAADHAVSVADVRARYSEHAFNYLWQKGRELTSDEACAVAMRYECADLSKLPDEDDGPPADAAPSTSGQGLWSPE
jgi:hypothetical protein